MQHPVSERLLHEIWRCSLYNPGRLCTTAGEPVRVLFPGIAHQHAGPDFEEGKIKVGDTTLVGNIELHLRSSDWHRHGHQHDRKYSNIILHVVLYDDLPFDPSSHIPVLELAPHIPQHIISGYNELQLQLTPVACMAQLHKVKPIIKNAWLSRMLAERWETRLGEWQGMLQQSAGDWRQLLYWLLAANFGFKINADPFLLLAQSLPQNILARHRKNLFQMEALLFGQAGMLQGRFTESYPFQLQHEYEHLRRKYRLEPIPGHLWKFLRMRPANFPTVRIAQFAALLHRSIHLFDKIVSSTSVLELGNLLEVKAGDYWDYHVRFDEAQKSYQPKQLGKDSIDNIITNTIAPLRFMYAQHCSLDADTETAVQLLEQLPPEHNKIIREWHAVGWAPVNAAQSQALLQLFRNYCTPRNCLSCSIGHKLIQTPA
jgi:hypothetical protein